MELSESEKATILRSLGLYKDTINFSLKNRKARRSNKEISKYIDLYEQE